ncbi:MAG: hypothetical protein R2838_21720 [Caldilineaceae bacterium]
MGVYDAVNDRSLSSSANTGTARTPFHGRTQPGTEPAPAPRRRHRGHGALPAAGLRVAHGAYPTHRLLSGRPRGDADLRFVAAAHHFWDRAVHNPAGSDRSNHFAHDVGWISYGLLRYGDPPLVDVEAAAKLPDDYARFFPVNRIWRVRRGLLSASFYGDTTRLLTLTMGRAELASLKISQTYFGQYTGRFIGQEFTLDDGVDHALPGRPQPAGPATNCRWDGPWPTPTGSAPCPKRPCAACPIRSPNCA